MDYKVTSPRGSWQRAGMTLVELMVGLAISSVVVIVLASFIYSSGCNLVALANYCHLGQQNRIAVDTLTADIRSAREVTAWTADSLTLLDFDGTMLSYNYSPETRMLTRTKGGLSQILLRDCDSMSFQLSQRTPLGGAFEVYPAASPETCKVVDVSWNTSRSIFGQIANSDDVQTARIVIRKK